MPYHRPQRKPPEFTDHASHRGFRIQQLFKRAASGSGPLNPAIADEINRAMLSEAEWLVEELYRLQQADCVDTWRIWRLEELGDYCRRGPSSAQQVKAFADFLTPRFSAEVHRTAAECIRLLLPSGPVSISVQERVAGVDSMDNPESQVQAVLEDARKSERSAKGTADVVRRVAGQAERLRKEKCLMLIDGLEDLLSVEEAFAVTKDWEATNRRRVELIELEINGQLSDAQREDLRRLQKLAWAKRNITVPLHKFAAIRDALRHEREGEHET